MRVWLRVVCKHLRAYMHACTYYSRSATKNALCRHVPRDHHTIALHD